MQRPNLTSATTMRNTELWDDDYFRLILGDHASNLISAKTEATSIAQQIMGLISETSNLETVTAAIKHLKSTLGVIKALNRNPIGQQFPIKKK